MGKKSKMPSSKNISELARLKLKMASGTPTQHPKSDLKIDAAFYCIVIKKIRFLPLWNLLPCHKTVLYLSQVNLQYMYSVRGGHYYTDSTLGLNYQA
jgi:hypothetical protein